MLGDGHVRFGGRTGETDQPKRWHRAPVRPNPNGQWLWLQHATGQPISAAVAEALCRNDQAPALPERVDRETWLPVTVGRGGPR